MNQLPTHPYQADPDAPPDWRGVQPCTCTLPRQNVVHDLPDTRDAQDEQRRRIGEDDTL